MIEQAVINLASTLLGVTFGTYLGSKIMKRELTKELSKYLLNEIPHLLQTEEFKERARDLARVFIRELGSVIYEELKAKTDE